MKRKSIVYIVISLVIISSIFVWVHNLSKTSTPDRLIAKLERAVNQQNKELLVECFPKFMRRDISMKVSENKMKEFYNNVIGVKKLKFQIINQSDMDSQSVKKHEEIIEKQYGVYVNLTDYQLIQVKYHENFETPIYEIVKIDGSYYIYCGGYYPSPIEYFFE